LHTAVVIDVAHARCRRHRRLIVVVAIAGGLGKDSDVKDEGKKRIKADKTRVKNLGENDDQKFKIRKTIKPTSIAAFLRAANFQK
jgi:hypothetical protein